MKINNTLPLEDLKQYGIVNSDNTFSKKLSEQDVDAFLKGSTLTATNDTTTVKFKLNSDNSLSVDAYQKDIINHKDLSTPELYELSNSNQPFHKQLAGYGQIVEMGTSHYNNNPNNEKTHFVTLRNDETTLTFFGNDLKEKLKDLKVGDNIQIENIGINKIQFQNKNDESQSLNRFDNVFKIEPLNENNKRIESRLYELDYDAKTVVSMDTTSFAFNMVNGKKLTDQQLQQLREGKEVDLDDDLTIQLSPKSQNEAKLTSNQKRLLLASVLLDGGMTFLIVRFVQKLNSMAEKKQQQIESNKYTVELQKLKGYLQSKAQQYPDNAKIKNDINIVGKEINSINVVNKSVEQSNKASQTTVRLQVNDRDTYEDANAKIEKEEYYRLKELSETKYKDYSIKDLKDLIPQKEHEYQKNLMADNNSTMKRIDNEIKDIQKIIQYRDQENEVKVTRGVKR